MVLLEKNHRAAEACPTKHRANGLAERTRVVEADLFDVFSRKAERLVEAADLVVTNPPYLNPGESRASPDSARARRMCWTRAASENGCSASLALLRPGGRFALIHRADALATLLAALEGRLGGLEIFLSFPKQGEKATRVILRGRKGVKTPLALLPGLVLHEAGGGFTPQAEEFTGAAGICSSKKKPAR